MAFDPITAGVGLASTALGAGLSYKGAKLANATNLRIAREQMGFQKESVDKQMQFQERMSNTAYQRAMEDMRKAGINPILAYNQGGASSPVGASAQGARTTVENQLGAAVNSAIAMRRVMTDLAKARADVALTNEMVKAAKYENVGKKVEAGIDEGFMGRVARVISRFNPLASMYSKIAPRG